MKVYAFVPRQPSMTAHSSMHPLMPCVNAKPILYDCAWKSLQNFSWTLGHLLQRFGTWYSGSELNATTPVWDELKFLRAIDAPGPSVAHFLLGETVAMKWPRLFHAKGAAIVGTFHATQWRQDRALKNYHDFGFYDWITVVSKSQIPFMVERGFPEERIRLILHGVDADYFRPAERRGEDGSGPLKALLVGKTERDHEFMARVMKNIPAGTIELVVATPDEQKVHYRDTPGVRLLDRVSDEELKSLYQSRDLLVMPMIDCTANNAILESMACGTPVLANRVGGIPEYVPESSSYILDGKKADEWADLLVHLSRNRQELQSRRAAAREWAENFAWPKKAVEYLEVYEAAVSRFG